MKRTKIKSSKPQFGFWPINWRIDRCHSHAVW